MYKIAAIGDRESVMGFASLGLSVFEATEEKEAEKLIDSLAKNEFAAIYITEELAAKIPDVIVRYRAQKLPAIIPIPGVVGNTGKGMRDVHANVEKAVGSDILNN